MLHVVLLSGGLDSAVALALAVAEFGAASVIALHFDYDHPARFKEAQAAGANARAHGLHIQRLFLDLQAHDMKAPPGTEGPRIVPARNTAFIAMAANRYPGARIVLGVTAEDQADYVDCRPMRLEPLAELCGCSLYLPLVEMHRAEVLAEAKRLGVETWWSCYSPDHGTPCGRCNSCRQGSPRGPVPVSSWAELERLRQSALLPTPEAPDGD